MISKKKFKRPKKKFSGEAFLVSKKVENYYYQIERENCSIIYII